MTDEADRGAEAGSAGRVSLDLNPAKQELRRLAHALEEFSTSESLAPRVANALALALEEAVTNVVFYAFEDASSGAQQIGVTVERRGDALHVSIRDNGRPFDPTAQAPRELPSSLEELEPGGLGIRIIRSVADKVEYRREQGCNQLDLELNLGSDAATTKGRTP